MKTGKIMNICRLRRDIDGAGITTLILMHGCHLHCRHCPNDYCHDDGTACQCLTARELADIVKIDDAYFRMSGGGITFGGGEPLLQAGFIREFAEEASEKWKLRIETSLNVPWTDVELLLPYVDQWIIDIKDTEPEIYLEYTGMDNSAVLSNLEKMRLRAGSGKIRIRIPMIRGYNTQKDINDSLVRLEKYACEKEVFSYIVPAR